MRVGKSNWRIDPALTDLSSFTSWPSFHSQTITVARKRFSTVQRERERGRRAGGKDDREGGMSGEIISTRLEREPERARKRQTNKNRESERVIHPPLTPAWNQCAFQIGESLNVAAPHSHRSSSQMSPRLWRLRAVPWNQQIGAREVTYQYHAFRDFLRVVGVRREEGSRANVPHRFQTHSLE